MKISSAISEEEKAENGEGYLTSRCAGGRGNTTHTPEAGGVKLQSPDSLGKMSAKYLIKVPIARFYFFSMSVL